MARRHAGEAQDVWLVVVFLRSLRKWTQGELSQASGVDRGAISAYEAGTKVPTRRTLQRLADATGLSQRFIDTRLLPLVREARQALEGSLGPGGIAEPENLADGLDREVLAAVLPAVAPYLIELEALRSEVPAPSPEDRSRAAELWASLKTLAPGRRRLAVESEGRFWSWALAERLCEESVKAAAHRADEAVELSRLALRVAELVPGNEAWRSHLLGWVWAFVANACRVQGDLRGAEEGYLRSDALLRTADHADPGLLDTTRPLDLKASLRRYQGRFDEALALLESALAVKKSAATRARLLINRANTLELMGNFEQAIKELRQAETLIERAVEKRLAFVVAHSLIRNLFELGRYSEAWERLPEARRLAAETGNELDLIRAFWAEGKVAASLGRREEAVAALEQTRRYFNANRIAYDAALASLDLAALHLEEGHTGEVRRLAEEMFWIFKAQGVHREALAALALFQEAVRQESATVELIRRVMRKIEEARAGGG